MKKAVPKPSWKEYRFRFSDMQVTIIDGPGPEWTCVFCGNRKPMAHSAKSARAMKGRRIGEA